jgi:peptide/nickel transport system permease protein
MKDVGLVAGAILFGATLVCALSAPVLSPFTPLAQNLDWKLQPPGWRDADGRVHLFGTDNLGRDILSRVMHGARVSLVVSALAVAMAGVIGIGVGLVAGYLGGAADRWLMRLVDIQLAFPFILLALGVIAVLGPSLRNLIVVMAVRGWGSFARIVRGQVLVVREREYVHAIRACGGSHARVLFRHILPNVLSACIVVGTLEMAQVIITETTLSFLGLGVQPPTPTWGGMLNDGREYLVAAWWFSAIPGAAIMTTVLGINLLGDGLRDALDPRLRV